MNSKTEEENKNLLLSVCIFTYQHLEYIAECIESVLNQKTTFPFEIIIGEDGSVDGTREICQQYAEKYPDRIRLISRSRKDVIYVNGNATGRFNFIETMKVLNGKYVAMIDGDDFWIDPLKLQKQVDVLEANPDCVCCHHWHKLYVRNSSGQFEFQEAVKENHGYFNQKISAVSEIFKFNMRTQTRTMMFRNIFRQVPFPTWFYKVRFGDLSLALILGKYGKFYFLDEQMAVYRVTGKGVSTLFNNEKGYISGNKSWLEIWAYALAYHDYKYLDEALIGMNVFLSRIRKNTGNSFTVRLNLIAFVILKMKMKYAVKRKLINSLLKTHKLN